MTIAENWVDELIRFWFEELTPGDWFVRNETLDEKIRARFLSLYEKVSERPSAHTSTARAALATVIVLDQFPRNCFRGTPRAFATDAQALAVAQKAIDAELDEQLPVPQRMFLYMPFQHAEDRAVQKRSVELFTALGDQQALGYAREHRDVVERFGRFPHRNAALGRTSTAEELDFMKHHAGF